MVKLILLLTVFAILLILDQMELIDWGLIFSRSEAVAGQWWAPVLLGGLMALFFALALPGSTFFWISSFLYTPLQATAIIVVGGSAGSILAYLVARWLVCRDSMATRKTKETPESHPGHTADQGDDLHEVEGTHDLDGVISPASPTPSAVMRYLEKKSDFFTLTAIRTLPFFPHSVINYSAGILAVPIGRFMAAACVGYALKGFIYASALHGASEAEGLAGLKSSSVVVPLLVLATLFLISPILHRKIFSRNQH